MTSPLHKRIPSPSHPTVRSGPYRPRVRQTPNALQMARWIGTIYVVGAFVAGIWTVIPHSEHSGDRFVLAMAGSIVPFEVENARSVSAMPRPCWSRSDAVTYACCASAPMPWSAERRIVVGIWIVGPPGFNSYFGTSGSVHAAESATRSTAAATRMRHSIDEVLGLAFRGPSDKVEAAECEEVKDGPRRSKMDRRAATDSDEPPVARSWANNPSRTLMVVAKDERTEPFSTSQFHPPSSSCSSSRRVTTRFIS